MSSLVSWPGSTRVVLLRVLVPVPPMAVEGTRQVAIEDVEKRRAEAEYLAAMAAELRAQAVLRQAEIPVFLRRLASDQAADQRRARAARAATASERG